MATFCSVRTLNTRLFDETLASWKRLSSTVWRPELVQCPPTTPNSVRAAAEIWSFDRLAFGDRPDAVHVTEVNVTPELTKQLVSPELGDRARNVLWTDTQKSQPCPAGSAT